MVEKNYIFGGNTGLSYEDIQRRRKIAESLMSKGTPRNIGEGLSSLGGDVAAAILSKKADKREAELRDEFNSEWGSFFGGLGGGSTGGFGGGSSAGGGGGYSGGSPAYAKPDPLAPQAIADDTMRALDKPVFSPNMKYDPNNPEKLAADTMAVLGKDPQYIKYENQGAIRNQPLDAKLVDALSFLPEIGVEGRVVSGGQPGIGSGGARTGSTRHDHGGAGDLDFYKDGRRLSTDNPQDMPIFQEIVRRASGAGLTGMGEGADYMGSGRMHLGYGAPAVWGAGGSTENAPQWLREAYAQGVGDYGSPQQAGPGDVRMSTAGTNWADAIAAVESDGSGGSGGYQAIGPETGKGRAYGKYQVMDFNIPSWTEKHYGERLTPEEFLARPEAQDAVFNGEFGSYVAKYGNPQDAASTWFTGKPLAQGGNRSDGYITGNEYVEKFNSALTGGGAPQATPAQYTPQGGAPASGGGVPQGGDMQTIMRLAQFASNPMASPGQKMVAQAMLAQQMQGMQPQEPKWQYIDGMGMVDMNNPPPELMAGNYQEPPGAPEIETIGGQPMVWDGQQYVLAPVQGGIPQQPGYSVITGEEAAAMGLDPSAAYNLGPDGRVTQVGGGGTNVTVNNVPQSGLGGEYSQPVTPAQEEVDKAFAKTYVEWTQGGGADMVGQIARIDEVADQLDAIASGGDGNLTGPGVGNVPDFIGTVTNPQAVQAREAVEEVVQRNLRVILGAQFTEKEGERLISRAYNPRLPEAENAARLRRLSKAMTAAAESRNSQAEYFEQNGTLTGWKGHQWSAGDFMSAIDGDFPDDAAPQPGAGAAPPPPPGANLTPEQWQQVWDGMTPEERMVFQ